MTRLTKAQHKAAQCRSTGWCATLGSARHVNARARKRDARTRRIDAILANREASE